MAHWLNILFLTLVLPTFSDAIYKKVVSPKSHSNKGRIPLNKCCAMNNVVDGKTCVKYDEELQFSTMKVYDNDLRKTIKSIEDTFELIPGKFKDEQFFDMSLDIEILEYNIYLSENGVLHLEMPNKYDRWTLVPPANYCVDYPLQNDLKTTNPKFWVILPDSDLSESNVNFTRGTMVSCCFMLLVIIIYCLVPDLMNLPGKIQVAYISSLFMAFLLLYVLQVGSFDGGVCVGLTMSIYFFFLASFCWMSIMSYDIWWTFRGYRKGIKPSRQSEIFKFRMYCLYAYTIPLCLTIAVLVLNSLQDQMKKYPWIVSPYVTERGCFFDAGVKLLYLYMPMLILNICNWIFYIMTAFNICLENSKTAVLDSSASAGSKHRHRKQWERFVVYLKLSVVMGLNWLLEIVSFKYPDLAMWYITDAYNILIGVALFIILICKKTTFKLIVKRYKQLRYGAQTTTDGLSSSAGQAGTQMASLRNREF